MKNTLHFYLADKTHLQGFELNIASAPTDRGRCRRTSYSSTFLDKVMIYACMGFPCNPSYTGLNCKLYYNYDYFFNVPVIATYCILHATCVATCVAYSTRKTLKSPLLQK